MVKEKITTSEQYLENLAKTQEPLERQVENLESLREKLGELIKKRLKEDVILYYGGSKERDTLLRDKPDLNIGIFWPEDTDKSMEELHALVGKTLKKKWSKTRSKNIGWEVPYKQDFSLSVIPGIILDSNTQNTLFYWESAEELIETSLKGQDEYIRENDRGSIVRLLKLWKMRKKVPLNSFILEIMCINACKGINRTQMERQAKRMFNYIYENIDKVNVYDPINEGNLISNVMNDKVKVEIKQAALQALQADNWGKVFK